MAKFVYIDESGDAGFKKWGHGASDYFVVAVVLVDDPSLLLVAMERFRDTVGMPRREEIKFSKTSKQRRVRFFEEIRQEIFSVRAVVVNKPLLVGKPETRDQVSLYTTVMRHALVRCSPILEESVIAIDEYLRGRTAQAAFNATMRQAVNAGGDLRRIKDIHHRTGQAEPLIQVSDMVAGAIHASRAQANDTYVQLIRARINDLFDWHGDESAEIIAEN